MKTITVVLLLLMSSASWAQSESYAILKSRFAGDKDVFSFHAGGFLVQTALWFSGEDLGRDIGEIRDVRMINIPKEEIRSRGLRLSGFKKILADDGFEQIVSVKERGEEVTIYLQEGKHDNRYFMLVEESNEVTAFEIRGNIDPHALAECHSKKTFQL